MLVVVGIRQARGACCWLSALFWWSIVAREAESCETVEAVGVWCDWVLVTAVCGTPGSCASEETESERDGRCECEGRDRDGLKVRNCSGSSDPAYSKLVTAA